LKYDSDVVCSMTKTIQKPIPIAIIVAAVAVAGLAASPILSNNIEIAYAGVPCVNTNQPAEPLTVDIVTTPKRFHTIIAEKEIFFCDVGIPVMREVKLLIQYTENTRNGNLVGSVEIISVTCDKLLQSLNIQCFTEIVPVGVPATEFDCNTLTGRAWIESDSAEYRFINAAGKEKIKTKTVIVDKEILDCLVPLQTGGSAVRLMDVFIIEEIVNQGAPTLFTVVCEKEISGSPRFLGCFVSDSGLPLPEV